MLFSTSLHNNILAYLLDILSITQSSNMIYHSWLGHAFHLSPPRTLHTSSHLLSTSLTKALAFSAAKERANSAPVFIGLLGGCHTFSRCFGVCPIRVHHSCLHQYHSAQTSKRCLLIMWTNNLVLKLSSLATATSFHQDACHQCKKCKQ